MKKQNYARLENNVVVEVVELSNDVKLSELYVPEIASLFIKAPDNVTEGWQFIDEKWIEPKLIIIPVNEIKIAFKNQIDKDAERERLKYITDGVGQSMTYQEKVNQAASYSKAYTAYLADPDNTPKPNESEYLLLASGLGIDGDTLIEAAETVTFAYAQWQYVGAAIEGVRLQAKLAIDEASSVEQAQAIYNDIQWPQI